MLTNLCSWLKAHLYVSEVKRPKPAACVPRAWLELVLKALTCLCTLAHVRECPPSHTMQVHVHARSYLHMHSGMHVLSHVQGQTIPSQEELNRFRDLPPTDSHGRPHAFAGAPAPAAQPPNAVRAPPNPMAVAVEGLCLQCSCLRALPYL